MESETAKNAVLERLESIRQKLRTACESAGRDPQAVTLMAVTKTVDPELINTAVDAGVHVLGENRVQEFLGKRELYRADAEVQFIGHLQTNKVKLIVPYISMIEAVDSLKLLREIQKQAQKAGRVVRVLLELHIAQEATKYGLTLDGCRELLDGGEWRQMPNVRICGLMMMASNTGDEDKIAGEFQTAATFFDEVKERYFADDPDFCERSWGMSDDYPIALETRSTMVRVGTAIFGPRVY